jgi:hypothetical protein
VIHFQPSFGKTPEVLDSITVSFASSKSLFAANTNAIKPVKVESVIRPKAVRINPGKWFHMLLNDALKRLVNMFSKHQSETSPLRFKSSNNEILPPSPLPLFLF